AGGEGGFAASHLNDLLVHAKLCVLLAGDTGAALRFRLPDIPADRHMGLLLRGRAVANFFSVIEQRNSVQSEVQYRRRQRRFFSEDDVCAEKKRRWRRRYWTSLWTEFRRRQRRFFSEDDVCAVAVVIVVQVQQEG